MAPSTDELKSMLPQDGWILHTAAEIDRAVGELYNDDRFTEADIPLLMELMNYPKAFVREGALMALANFMANPTVRSVIERTASNDPSDTIRDAAQELLESY